MSDTSASSDLSSPSARQSAPATRARRKKGGWGKWLLLLLLIGGGIAGAQWYLTHSKQAPLDLRTNAITRGNIIQEVTANGALSAVKNVEVGSQVSGIVQDIKVDYNSPVKEGELLARIDPSSIQQNLAQADAELANSKASLELAEVNYRRAKELFKAKLISASEHDTTLATLHQAEANVKIREASVERVKVDLSHTSIYAPISGIVISRNVDEGQTVAASFNTPRLFVIANDLSKMQIEAAVSEADVGGVDEGQRVSFSVDAFPNRRFNGTVKQVRYAALTNQNVVTYTAVVEVNNPDLKLRPGMTATARIVTAQKENVLRLPNAALRFRPPTNLTVVATGMTNAALATNAVADASIAPEPPWRAQGRPPAPGERDKWMASLTPEQRERMQQARGMRGGGGGGGGGRAGGGGFGDSPRRSEGPTTVTVYAQEKTRDSEGKEVVAIKALSVRVGITDGNNTEVIEGLKEGDVIITGINMPTPTIMTTQPNNPFAPNFGGGRGGPGGGGRGGRF